MASFRTESLTRFAQVCDRLGERTHGRIRRGAFRRERRNRGGACIDCGSFRAAAHSRACNGKQGVTGGEALNHISPNMVVQVL